MIVCVKIWGVGVVAVFKISKFAKSSKSFKSRNFENLKFEVWRLYRWGVRICAWELRGGWQGRVALRERKGEKGGCRGEGRA